MTFKSELEFEEQLIKALCKNGWEDTILKNQTEHDLVQNWANILFKNNRQRTRLNNYPLTDTEMQQIIGKVVEQRTPLALNSLINGKTISIKRDNPNDKEHLGQEVSLKIYDRQEIAAGQSKYQIAEQPRFRSKIPILPDRRGDFVLLINGMPVIHVELKKSGIPVTQACNQIVKYSDEGVFSGLFSLVQVFVAMTPEETLYFANPGPDGKFNPDFYFHWADFNNEPINDWKKIASTLLCIPMAHQLIGFYTVADNSDGILKVMRSYQYYAANAISDKVSKIKWDDKNQRGGYIWHTTGSGKTMTSFKSAQLISSSKDADKVVFLTDRIELGLQSLKEYRAFADIREVVQGTENTKVLTTKLKSDKTADCLIVTSIQKMSNIQLDPNGLNTKDIEVINKKRIVFIVDEAHRSTFGEMLSTIKNTFPRAIFFGFTGTPIHDENKKNNSTTSTIFGNELHRYSIADGIRDKNVLGFDLYKVLTFKDKDLRRAVALTMAKAHTEEEAIKDPKKNVVYYQFMDASKVPMASYRSSNGNIVHGIEEYIPTSQYLTDEHKKCVVENIRENWVELSHAGKFHALFATSSIHEAIEYYRLLKKAMPEQRFACLFDPSTDNNYGIKFKEDGLKELIDDYNETFNQSFSIPTFAAMKKDISFRLSHKEQYKTIAKTPELQIDVLIVVDQMLTGFDSKWINTLYLDKVLHYENIIQAFSRTNRLFGPTEKPFGTIKYYRYPHTMERNIEAAVKLYSGDKVYGLFVDKLPGNLKKLNETFKEIYDVFKSADVGDFKKLPAETEAKAKFAKLFNKFNILLGSAKIQGFKWTETIYEFSNGQGVPKTIIEVQFTQQQYDMLVARYKELGKSSVGPDGNDAPYDINGYLMEIETEDIDNDYMNSKFKKYLIALSTNSADKAELEQELHKTFATLSQEQQKYANIFLHDIERGEVDIQEGKTFKDYIIEYQSNAQNAQLHNFAETFGLDVAKLQDIMNANVTDGNINEYGRLDELKETVDKEKARKYFSKALGMNISVFKANKQMDALLRRFILEGGFDL